jgi:Zn-dependent alcohol dehydrogenase
MYRKQVRPDILLTQQLRVKEINKAIDVHRAGQSIKVLITP